jgi:YHS domain-containing protein
MAAADNNHDLQSVLRINAELVETVQQQQKTIQQLREELAQVKADNVRLRTRLGETAPIVSALPPMADPVPRPPAVGTGGLPYADASSGTAAKIALFRALFAGREDVYARRWVSSRTGRTGWSPAEDNPFEKNKDKHFAAIDQKLIERQKAHYPLDACIVSGRKLDDSDTVHDMIHEGRLVRFCCPNCPRRFNADPDRYMVRLDEAIIKQQRERYPLNTCVVAGMELGSMGEPYERIVGGTLVRFCCAGCVGGFKDNPMKHLATIRDAWRKQHESQNGEH